MPAIERRSVRPGRRDWKARSARRSDWYGTKDRSWGVRGVGEREPSGAPTEWRGAFFLWAPLFWDDHVSHAVFFDGPNGEALVREGLIAPLFAFQDDVPAELVNTATRMATAAHRITYHEGTRLAAAAELDLVHVDGSVRTIALASVAVPRI